MEKETADKAGGKKDYDTREKELEDYPDVFADIINALVYGGEQIVNPDFLVSASPETRYRVPCGTLKKQLEDIGKYEVDEGEAKALFLLANQTKIDSRMILRKCGYTGGYYRGQYNGQAGEICPVLELVLYWGRKRWRSESSIRSFFRKKRLPVKAWDFIDDEKLHVFEMRYLPRNMICRFTGDMRIVLECLSENPNRDCLKQEIKHKEALLELVNVLLEEEEYRKLFTCLNEAGLLEDAEEGGRTMIDIIKLSQEEWKKAGLQEGISQGISQGIQALITTCKEFNVSFEETADKLKEKFSLTDAEVQQDMKLYW